MLNCIRCNRVLIGEVATVSNEGLICPDCEDKERPQNDLSDIAFLGLKDCALEKLQHDDISKAKSNKVVIVLTTDDGEFCIAGANTIEQAQDKIAETESDKSGWYVHSIFVDRKKAKFGIVTTVKIEV